MMHELRATMLTLAQDVSSLPDAPGDPSAPAREPMSWLDVIGHGGIVGYLLIALSMVALALVFMHLYQIRRAMLVPPGHVQALDNLLSRGDVNGALEFCLTPQNDSFLTRVLGAGLTRFQRSAFGAFEIKNAVEEAGQEQIARLYRATDALSVIGSIAPLLGLLGTVLGMVGAFDTLSVGAAPDHKQLASNISLALVCTLLGLVLAIPCLALFTFFRNRIDGLAAEAATVIEQLLLHLESPQGARAAAPPPRYAPAAPARPLGSPAPPLGAAASLGPVPNPAPPGATFPGRA